MVIERKSRPRSKAYPAMDLAEALKRVDKINENFGLTGTYNRETMATGMGYASLSGTSSRAIAALVQYGLLSRLKDQYMLSALAKKYLIPVEDHDTEHAIREAATSPSLFKDIYDKFSGQTIPKQFVNRLINEFGIQQKAAPDVERIFKSTVETAGILGVNGILKSVSLGVDKKTESPVAELGASDAATKLGTDSFVSERNAQLMGYQEYVLGSGVKVSFPIGMSLRLAMGEFAEVLKNLDEKAAGESSTDNIIQEHVER